MEASSNSSSSTDTEHVIVPDSAFSGIVNVMERIAKAEEMLAAAEHEKIITKDFDTQLLKHGYEAMKHSYVKFLEKWKMQEHFSNVESLMQNIKQKLLNPKVQDRWTLLDSYRKKATYVSKNAEDILQCMDDTEAFKLFELLKKEVMKRRREEEDTEEEKRRAVKKRKISIRRNNEEKNVDPVKKRLSLDKADASSSEDETRSGPGSDYDDDDDVQQSESAELEMSENERAKTLTSPEQMIRKSVIASSSKKKVAPMTEKKVFNSNYDKYVQICCKYLCDSIMYSYKVQYSCKFDADVPMKNESRAFGDEDSETMLEEAIEQYIPFVMRKTLGDLVEGKVKGITRTFDEVLPRFQDEMSDFRFNKGKIVELMKKPHLIKIVKDGIEFDSKKEHEAFFQHFLDKKLPSKSIALKKGNKVYKFLEKHKTIRDILKINTL